MKYYETSFEEYLNSSNKFNLHPNVNKMIQNFPNNVNDLSNFIFYGPPGSGKYTQVLNLLRKYSPSNLKYDKKVTTFTEKQNYKYHISDIHYEIDMELLGCHSKLLWHEIFLQIIDIIITKNNKFGFIVCKNFHYIHNELLEIFYSYMQHYANSNSIIKLYFIIITENISFLPNNIVQSSLVINIEKPNKKSINGLIKINNKNKPIKITETNLQDMYKKYISNIVNINNENNLYEDEKIIENIDNLKKIKNFNYFNNEPTINYFNIICNSIIQNMKSKKMDLNDFRENLYDVFIYNLDSIACIWYILSYFIENNYLKSQNISNILSHLNNSLLYFNNNYRPIYHLENILLYIIDNFNNEL